MSIRASQNLENTGQIIPRAGNSPSVPQAGYAGPSAAPAKSGAVGREEAGQKPSGRKQQRPELELEQGVAFLNKLSKVFDFKLQFRVHKETNRIFAKVVDPETDKVLREIPPEKMLDMIAKMEAMLDEMAGFFLDDYV